MMMMVMTSPPRMKRLLVGMQMKQKVTKPFCIDPPQTPSSAPMVSSHVSRTGLTGGRPMGDLGYQRLHVLPKGDDKRHAVTA